jgi:hypothetical protein
MKVHIDHGKVPAPITFPCLMQDDWGNIKLFVNNTDGLYITAKGEMYLKRGDTIDQPEMHPEWKPFPGTVTLEN